MKTYQPVTRTWLFFDPAGPGSPMESSDRVPKNRTLIPFCEACLTALGRGSCDDCAVYDVMES